MQMTHKILRDSVRESHSMATVKMPPTREIVEENKNLYYII